jgi:hypothetical protein
MDLNFDSTFAAISTHEELSRLAGLVHRPL